MACKSKHGCSGRRVLPVCDYFKCVLARTLDVKTLREGMPALRYKTHAEEEEKASLFYSGRLGPMRASQLTIMYYGLL